MKTQFKSLLIAILALCTSLTTYANDTVPAQELRQEIKTMLKDIELPSDADFHASIEFLINENNEIVVVSVETDELFIDRIIKGRLNYKEVRSTIAIPNKINKLKVILKGG